MPKKTKRDASYWTTLGGKIRKAREGKGLSQRELGALIDGISGGAVFQWEQNDAEPRGKHMVKLLKVLPELNLSDKLTPDAAGVASSENLTRGLEHYGSKRLRLLADIIEQREQLESKLRELSENTGSTAAAKR